MAGGQAGLLRHIHRLWDLGTFAGLTDAQLLERFAARHEDGAEPAFEALVERHGPMVFRVCRGVLRDEHAAEDAFQATFLVLARKARSLWVKDSLGSWLHGVAHRVASRARSDAARRHRHEQRLAEGRGPAWEVIPDRPRSDAAAILSEEIARLPEKYRAPIVLCYLEALSYEAAAPPRRLRGRDPGPTGAGPRAAAGAVDPPGCRDPRHPRRLPAVNVGGGHPDRIGAGDGPGRDGPRGVRGVGLRRDLPIGDLPERKDVQDHDADQVEGGRGRPGARSRRGRSGRVGPAARGRTWRELGPCPDDPTAPAGRPRQGGHLIVDWIPADSQGGKREITVNPKRHCCPPPHGPTSLKRDDRLNDGMVHLDLEPARPTR